MADLEEMGFVASPHTSAGRVPTPRGYRLFVDSLLTVMPIEQQQTQIMQDQLQIGDPARAMQSAAQLLSSLSQFAGVVLTPRRASSFKQVEFVRLSERRILLIIVTPEGDVQNRVLMTDAAYSQAQLVEAANILNEHYAGLSFNDARARLHGELRLGADITQLLKAAVQAGSDAVAESQPVVISGERNLLGLSDLATDMAKLRRMFDLFDHKTRLIQLLDVSIGAHGVQIYIGGESQTVPLDDLSMVVAPYEVDGKVVGTLGVIGPTRMAYERVFRSSISPQSYCRTRCRRHNRGGYMRYRAAAAAQRRTL